MSGDMNDDIDYFREDNPDHHAQLLADLMNWEPEPESMLSPPASKIVQCVSCHADFEAEPQIFRGRWQFPCLCSVDCGDVPEEIRADVETLAQSFSQYASKLKDIGITPGTTPSAAQLQQLQAALTSLDQVKLTAASKRIEAWSKKNCRVPPRMLTGGRLGCFFADREAASAASRSRRSPKRSRFAAAVAATDEPSWLGWWFGLVEELTFRNRDLARGQRLSNRVERAREAGAL